MTCWLCACAWSAPMRCSVSSARPRATLSGVPISCAMPAASWPAVASFLAKSHLPVEVVRPQVPVYLAPPETLRAAGKDAFVAYLASEGVEKAFAVGGHGWGWSSGRRTRDDAVQKALANCAAHARVTCAIYAVDDARAP